MNPDQTNPTAAFNMMNVLVMLLTPILVAGVKWLAPKIPTWLLPILSGMFGPALALLAHAATGTGVNPNVLLVIGLAGVGVREIQDQVRGRLSNGATVSLLFLMGFLAFTVGCKTPNLEEGGAYSPVVTNELGQVIHIVESDRALYVSDAVYKLAFNTALSVFRFEKENREELQKISPNITKEMNKLRFIVKDVNQRWATARSAYKENPTPSGLKIYQQVVAEMERTLEAVQAAIQPAKLAATSTK